MKAIPRILAMIFIFILTSIAWVSFGGIMQGRSSQQRGSLYGDVAELWGQPLAQQAPTLNFHWVTVEQRRETQTSAKGEVTVRTYDVQVPHDKQVFMASTDMDVGMHLDQRRKGLLWFSLYDVDLQGTWTYVHDEPVDGVITLMFDFPSDQGVYDGFHIQVDGEERTGAVSPGSGQVQVAANVTPGQTVTFGLGYRSRGMDQWEYKPTQTVGEVRDFRLTMTTDFTEIDYPAFTMSPSARERQGQGWKLDWDFSGLVTGHGIGMVVPQRIQPGVLASHMSFSAPISLGFFMIWIFVIGVLKKVEVHPVNHLFLAAAFFSFHLLFGYLADHLAVGLTFGIAAAASVILVVSYLRLVVGTRFAFLEAGMAQLLYLVGFSLAHFWEGYTGLTVTILGIFTLFLLMQLTGRIKWSEVLSGQAGRS
ncbi:MAG: inner membrane CreD family protein [Pseudomonadota bacterium]